MHFHSHPWPDLIIAHPSRCGSTLLARLAASGGDTQLVLEPPLLLQLLRQHSMSGLDRPFEQVLRGAIQGLGRVQCEGKRQCVLKLSSQTTRFLPVIRKALPQVPVIWLQRQPAEVVESNVSHPAAPGRAMAPDAMRDWSVRRVTLAFLAAKAFVDDKIHVLDYRDLPDRAWIRVAEIMGFDPAAHSDRMRELMRIDSKSGKPYVARARRPLSVGMQKIVRDTLDPMYEALDLRRQG